VSTAERPLPDVADPLHAPFWEGTAAGELRAQRCEECGYLRWPPERLCPECLSLDTSWAALTGKGSVWSYAVYEHAYHPAFELDEGPLMISRIVERVAPSIQVDVRVTATFPELAPGVHLVYFELEVGG
jgi:uncharacterized OB-fold protein